KRGLMEAVRPLLLRRWAGPVLVVGGGGYIGTHVVEQLLAEGWRVRVLDRLLFGKAPLQDFFGNPRFELVEGDATDILKLIEAMQGASAVVHLAGLVGDPACAVDESFTRHANLFATRLVKKAAPLLSVQRLVFASSCSVYGINPAEVNETSEVNPVSLYARTKVERERGQIFNVGDRRLNMTIGQLARLVQESVSHTRRVEVVEMPSKDLRNYAVSFQKIRRELGFEAETLMEAGIEEIVAEFTKGTYGHYRDAVYSNLAMTKRVLPDFRRRTAHLYQPVAAAAGADRGQSRTGVWYPSGVDLSVSGTGI